MTTYSGIYKHWEGTESDANSTQEIRELVHLTNIDTLRFKDCSGVYHYFYGTSVPSGMWEEISETLAPNRSGIIYRGDGLVYIANYQEATSYSGITVFSDHGALRYITNSGLADNISPYLTGVAGESHASTHESGGDDIVYHDNLSGYVSDEHIDHTIISINAGSGLSGGGDLSSSRTINFSGGTGLVVSDNIVEVSGVPLDRITDPNIDHTINMSNKVLTWLFSNPAGGVLYEWTGAAQGHLFELQQNTGNPDAGTHLLHIEAEDNDVILFHGEHSSASNSSIALNVTGDSSSRFYINANGDQVWGDGASSGDTNLYRETVNTLKTDDKFKVGSGLYTSGILSIGTIDNLSSGTSVLVEENGIVKYRTVSDDILSITDFNEAVDDQVYSLVGVNPSYPGINIQYNDNDGTLLFGFQKLGIQDLGDPDDDRIMFWDNSHNRTDWLDIGDGLSITGTTLLVDTIGWDQLTNTPNVISGNLTAGYMPVANGVNSLANSIVQADASSITVNGNATLGNASTDEHTVNGTLTVINKLETKDSVEMLFDASSGDPRIVYSAASDNPYIDYYRWTGGGSNYYGTRFVRKSSAGFFIQNATSTTIGGHSWSDALGVLDDGNVSMANDLTVNGYIGVGTSNPARRLSVHEPTNTGVYIHLSNSDTTSGTNSGATISIEPSGFSPSAPDLVLRNNEYGGHIVLEPAVGDSGKVLITSYNSGTDAVFGVETASKQRLLVGDYGLFVQNGGMRISSGNDTSNPGDGELQVEQGINAGQAIQTSTWVGSINGGFKIYSSASSYVDVLDLDANDNTVLDTLSASESIILNVNGTESARVTSDGVSVSNDLGVGITPARRLHVYESDTTGSDRSIFLIQTARGGGIEYVCSDLAAGNPAWTLKTFFNEQLRLRTGANLGQLDLETNGNVSMANQLSVDGKVTVNTIYKPSDSSLLGLYGSTALNNGSQLMLYGRDNASYPGDCYLRFGGYDATGDFYVQHRGTSSTNNAFKVASNLDTTFYGDIYKDGALRIHKDSNRVYVRSTDGLHLTLTSDTDTIDVWDDLDVAGTVEARHFQADFYIKALTADWTLDLSNTSIAGNYSMFRFSANASTYTVTITNPTGGRWYFFSNTSGTSNPVTLDFGDFTYTLPNNGNYYGLLAWYDGAQWNRTGDAY